MLYLTVLGQQCSFCLYKGLRLVFFTHGSYDDHPSEHASHVYAFILKNFVHVCVHKHKGVFKSDCFIHIEWRYENLYSVLHEHRALNINVYWKLYDVMPIKIQCVVSVNLVFAVASNSLKISYLASNVK